MPFPLAGGRPALSYPPHFAHAKDKHIPVLTTLDSALYDAVQRFFQNGGAEAWIVRVAKNAKKASISLRNKVTPAGVEVLTAQAVSKGNGGNRLCLSVNSHTTNADSLFNLTITEYVKQNRKLAVSPTERLQNLTMNSEALNYAVDVVKGGLDLIRLARTASAETDVASKHGQSESGVLGLADFNKLPAYESGSASWPGNCAARTSWPYLVSVRRTVGVAGICSIRRDCGLRRRWRLVSNKDFGLVRHHVLRCPCPENRAAGRAAIQRGLADG